MTIALSPRNTATSGMATFTASVNPSRNTPPRMSSSTIVMATACPRSASGMSGFSTRCTEASADDRVMVMIQDVATNPSRTRTKTLPRQKGSSRSSIAIDPCPWGLSLATRRYIGSMPSSVRATIRSVAIGETAPAARMAIEGRYDSVEK